MGNQGGKNKHKYKELTPSKLAYLARRTEFDPQEIREWHVGFCRDCPDDKLTREKFLEIYKKYYVDDHRAKAFCDYVFGLFDKNDDGIISFEEFLLAIAYQSQGGTIERVKLAFDMYDVSGNGEMDKKELANLIKAMYDLVGITDRKDDRDPKKRAKKMIEQLDEKAEKKLTKDNFVHECQKDEVLWQLLNHKT